MDPTGRLAGPGRVAPGPPPHCLRSAPPARLNRSAAPRRTFASSTTTRIVLADTETSLAGDSFSSPIAGSSSQRGSRMRNLASPGQSGTRGPHRGSCGASETLREKTRARQLDGGPRPTPSPRDAIPAAQGSHPRISPAQRRPKPRRSLDFRGWGPPTVKPS